MPGAAPQRGHTAEPASRRDAFALGGRALVAAGGALALGRPRDAGAQPPAAEQLERLLALEQRLESAYAGALARGAIDRALGERLLGHEREHVRGLEQTLRGRRSPRATAPPARFGAALDSRSAFARFAIELERETVLAYQEVLATLRNERLLLPLGSIMASGAQHVVALRQAAGEELLARG